MAIAEPPAPTSRRTRSSTRPRRSRATTSSSRTGRWSRRWAARAADWARERVTRARRVCGGDPSGRPARGQANENPPMLRTHDRFGHRIDEVEFHPAWHELMAAARIAHGRARARRGASPQPGAHVARAAMFMYAAQVEAGLGCPISMTYAAVPALRAQPELADEWEPRLTVARLRPRASSPRRRRRGALCGMAMTEKQGGSDVRANTTTARPLNGGGPGAEYELTGHKWFCSAPMCDALPGARAGRRRALVLRSSRASRPTASATSSASSGSRTSSATAPTPPARSSSTAPGRGWSARRAAACPRSSRWSTTRGWTACSAARAGHARGRRAGDLAHRAPRRVRQAADRPAADAQRARRPRVESEAATVTALRLARAFDEPEDDEQRGAVQAPRHRRRASTGCASARRSHAGEALECLGGNGYVEESGMPRLYREAPLNSIWEGSGNVHCLDVLRALATQPGLAGGVLRRDRAGRRGRAAPGRRSPPALREEFADLEAIEARARRVVERMALALQGSLLVRHAPPGGRRRLLRLAAATATAASRSARCRPARTSGRSSIATSRSPDRTAAGARSTRCATIHTMFGRSGSIQLARVFGIRIGVDVSWFIVLFFFIFILSGSFRTTLNSTDTVAYATAVASALLFFVSLVLHELGHALVARRAGHRRSSGSTCGSSAASRKMSSDTESPGAEFKVAVAGPDRHPPRRRAVRGHRLGGGRLGHLRRRGHAAPRRRRHARARAAGLAGQHQRVRVRVQPDPGLPDGRRADRAGDRLAR